MVKEIKPIRTAKGYELTLEELEKVFDATKGTPENDLAEVLVTLIDKYESENHPIEAPVPFEATKIRHHAYFSRLEKSAQFRSGWL